MRSVKATLITASIIVAGAAVAAPAASAATAPHQASAACNAAVAAANKAEAAATAAATDLKNQIAGGGHPGTAEESNVTALQNAANLATSDAARICGVSPVGPVKAGAGSMSRGADTTEAAAGVTLLGAVGAGVVTMRRRRIGDQA